MPFQLALFDNPCPEKVRNSTIRWTKIPQSLDDLLGEFSDCLVTEVNMGDDLTTQESVMVIEGPS
ncbi:hypothetical protein [Ferrimicrobium sp.]|uniref:hypothetical protein n=1 Tax=Ferrimicrobium sp. TaxID=2926050 RepID=UPI00262E582D|nr:hypothetical protein [Ferrimicrobium sp.]